MTPWLDDGDVRLFHGDCVDVLRGIESESVQSCVTSPPYWGLRDYGEPGQLGLEETPEEYVANMVTVFREVRRVLRNDGTLWLNLGDCYAARIRQSGEQHAGALSRSSKGVLTDYQRPLPNGLKEKDLVGIPWRVAFALQSDGWYLRSDIVWHKPNPMPESVTDRPTKAHEYVFLLTKQPRYFYDADAIREPHAGRPSGNAERVIATGEVGKRLNTHLGSSVPWVPSDEGRNARSVWTIATKPYAGAHFATFPTELPERCIKAGTRPGDTVLDPFNGAGTTALVARNLGRRAIGIELNEDYLNLAADRLKQLSLFAEGAA